LSELKEKSYRAFLWEFIGKFSLHVSGFIVSIFLARLLEPRDFGIMAIVLVLSSIARVFVESGFSAALIQKKNVTHLDYSSVFYFNLVISCLFASLTILISNQMATFYAIPELALIIKVVSSLFIINSLSMVQIVILQKKFKFKAISQVSVTSGVVSGTTGILLAHMGFGVWALVWQNVIFSTLYFVLLWYVAKWRPERIFSYRAIVSLWRYGSHVFVSGLINTLFLRLDYLLIVKVLSAQSLGYYQRAKQLNLLFIDLMSNSLNSVLFPMFSEIQDDMPRLKNVFISIFRIYCFGILMICGVVYLTAEEFIIIVYTDKWLPTVPLLKLVFLSAWYIPFSYLFSIIYNSIGNSKVMLRLNLITKVIFAFNFGTLLFFNIETYLVNNVILSFVNVVILFVSFSRDFEIRIGKLFRPFVESAIITIICVVLSTALLNDFNISNTIGLMAKLIVFCSSYLVLNYLFRTQSGIATYKIVADKFFINKEKI
jgi:O-antigen/teichoic acid export membrane protein